MGRAIGVPNRSKQLLISLVKYKFIKLLGVVLGGVVVVT